MCACGSGVCACVCVGGRVCVLVVVISVCGMLTYMSNYFRPIYISNVLPYTHHVPAVHYKLYMNIASSSRFVTCF